MCDGYGLRASIETTNEAARAQVVPGHPTSVMLNPRLGIPGTHEESGLFEDFYYSCGRKISDVLHLKLAHDFVLQTYHSDKAVRSVVIAITALTTGYQAEAGNGLFTQPASEFTLRQYHKSLQWLQKLIVDDPGRPIELTLVSCLLLACFEFMRGDCINSYIHCHSGLKILRRETTPSQGLSPLKKEILYALSGIDRRTALWYYVDPDTLHQRPVMWRRCSCSLPRMGDARSSVYEAAKSLNALMGCMYQSWNFMYDDESSETIFPIHEKLEVKRDALYTRLDKLAWAMDTFVTKLSNDVSRDMSHQIAALMINETLSLLMLDLASPSPEHLEGLTKKHLFLHIVKLAEFVIRTGSVERIVAASHGKYGSIAGGDCPIRTGVILPLHFTSIECQDLELRQTAISLLTLKPWREGQWDSASVAREIERKSGQNRIAGEKA